MRRARRFALMLTAALCGATLATSGRAAPTCDRACLTGVLDRYLAAVVAHRPEAAGLAQDFRATENASGQPVGTGVWQSLGALGGVQRRFADPVAGQAAYLGQVVENGKPAIASVRIRVADRRVAEAEWTVAREGQFGMFDAAGLAANPPPAQSARPHAPTTRAAMIAVGDAYFDGLERHDGTRVPKIAGCERVENGVRVTHRVRPPPAAAVPAGGGSPAPGAAPAGAAPGLAQESMSGDCTDGFEGFAHSIAKASLRRYPLIDERAGVVIGSTIFLRPPESTMRRNLLTEYFYVDGGKLAGIWAAMYYLDPAAPPSSGWE